jgi:hypothetical protein
MSDEALEKVRRLEAEMLAQPQAEITTNHVFHAGLYARTIRIPAGVALSGAFITRATLLIVSGECTVFTGHDTLQLRGYHVIPASAGRKQVFLAHADTELTMLFPSSATTVEEAEAEFTDEAHRLMSRRHSDRDSIAFTGE